LVAVFGASVSVAGFAGVTVTFTVWTALGVPSTTAVAVHEYNPGTVGAVIVSVNEMSTGAVNGPYGGTGLNEMPTGGQAPDTTRFTESMCAAAAWI